MSIRKKGEKRKVREVWERIENKENLVRECGSERGEGKKLNKNRREEKSNKFDRKWISKKKKKQNQNKPRTFYVKETKTNKWLH